jgi:hypothetical protein
MGEGDGKPLMFVAKPPHFFKVILEDSLREGKLVSHFLFYFIFYFPMYYASLRLFTS